MFSVAEQKSTESPPPLHQVGPIPEGDQQDLSKVTKEDFPMTDHPTPEVTTYLNDGSSATIGESSQVDVPVGDGRGSIIVSGPKRSLRSSMYHGVTKHRSSGKFEAYLWDNRCRLEGRTRKGRQGNYDSEEKAARARDLTTLKCNSSISRMKLNFPVSDYENELQAMKDLSQEEFFAYIRSSSFSRGASDYRGVTRGPKDVEWHARISQVGDVGEIRIGTFKTEEEAAEAYDIAAIGLRGPNVVTNFDIRNYCRSGLGLSKECSLRHCCHRTARPKCCYQLEHPQLLQERVGAVKRFFLGQLDRSPGRKLDL